MNETKELQKLLNEGAVLCEKIVAKLDVVLGRLTDEFELGKSCNPDHYTTINEIVEEEIKKLMKAEVEVTQQANDSGASTYYHRNIGKLRSSMKILSEKEAIKSYFELGVYHYAKDSEDGIDHQKRAKFLFGVAADKGHADAQFHLGQIYKELYIDKGYKAYLEDAVKYYRKAADQGHEFAKALLTQPPFKDVAVPEDEDEDECDCCCCTGDCCNCLDCNNNLACQCECHEER
jgi:TPR repeat protein